ncbi:MAG TPA: hypothetical protein VF490_21330 [Chryseosolibacter sp.]
MRPYSCLFIVLSAAAVLGTYVRAEAQDKITPRIDVGYHQSGGDRYLTVKVRKKVQKRFEPVAEIPVEVSLDLPEGPLHLGDVVTDTKGEARIAIAGSALLAIDSLDEYSFSAAIAGSDSVAETSESAVIRASRLTIKTDDADKSIAVVLEAKNAGTWEPVAGAAVGVFIQRRFGRIAVGEDSYTTDESGKVELNFDTDIPGDQKGMLTLEASMEDNDELGNISTTTTARWGVPLHPGNNFGKRTLWATRDKTPWWLLVFPNAMIAGVWGVIVYLIVSLFKIKRASKVS